jgi:NFU1 iron-sulfur cluster scaffold homolog, mitochondrial
MIPIHATATASPQQLRWVVPADRLPARGAVRAAPGRLGTLLDDGVIDEMVVGAAEVLISLRAESDWRELGDDIREALSDALSDPAGWRVDSAPDNTAELAELTAALLAGPIGALAQSHGGSIELVSIDGHDVTVRLSGACHGCPAAATTLHDKLQRELRRQTGHKITVHTENTTAATPLGKKLLSLIVR